MDERLLMQDKLVTSQLSLQFQLWRKKIPSRVAEVACDTDGLVPERNLQTFDSLDLNSLPWGKVTRCWVSLGEDGLACPIRVPVIIAKVRKRVITMNKGVKMGPTLGKN